MNTLQVKKKLQEFFLEDIGEGDLTSSTLFSENDWAEGRLIAKQKGVFCGVDVLGEGYRLLDDRFEITPFIKDGDPIEEGQLLALVKGPVQALLTGERVILNLIQRMSGVATLTKIAVDTVNSEHTRICDTRKTTPGLRMFEKYAVTCGGGFNHRLGLYDGVMIKDNHIAHTGSITNAVCQVKEKLGHMVKILVETEKREQVEEAVQAGADVIMFDNRSPEEIKEFIKLVPESIMTEASGGITLSNLAEYGKTGVDYISLGMLTHSAVSLDISLNISGGMKDERIGSFST
ncbi:carboxylating nicotinate-nucleotide diphosphorylase [Fictibacillus sp. Mic-4]|uniref:carboxylating nicotinate-nucleotide diphosphorylase n=1 Tax=Fictibacillus sp. Mic-4 TaxID=3132826 RepID=UPI003CE9C7E4